MFWRLSFYRILCGIILTMSIVAGYAMRRNLFSAGRFHSLYSKAFASSFQHPSHPSYERIQDFQIKEYGLNGSIFKHKKSGAQVLSLIAPDDNKVFGISFRTPPTDRYSNRFAFITFFLIPLNSTGVPHILEHSVLCGSRKFPVKEPFVELLRGSLQNFLNAFTYPDRTCYPVASTNTKDFYNLINVYLDAVFFPRAMKDPQVLQQEGWHYELEKPEDPLTIKGVVFNEMKGVYSSPEQLLGRETQTALFPENTYFVDSGGDPKDIPALTFEGFKSFHGRCYHPSNSRIYFYGDDDPAERLQLLDGYLNEFSALSSKEIDSSKVAFQKKMNLLSSSSSKEPLKYHFPITSDIEPKHMFTVNWLLNDQHLSIKEMLSFHLLDYLLLGTSTSELKKILTESNLGQSLIGGGLSDELQQLTFSIGLKGLSRENVEKLQPLILSALQKLAKDGFPADAITAAVNTLEFRLREFNTGSYPKGLAVMLCKQNFLF
jgi:Zn-dependent M16 (insulinase) family peptidase